MNNAQNQKGKVLEGMLAGFNLDAVKTTLRGLCRCQNGLPLLQVREKLPTIPLA